MPGPTSDDKIDPIEMSSSIVTGGEFAGCEVALEAAERGLVFIVSRLYC